MAIEKDDLFKKVRFIYDHYDSIVDGTNAHLFSMFLNYYNQVLKFVSENCDDEENGIIFLRSLPKFRSQNEYESLSLKKFILEYLSGEDTAITDMKLNRKEILDACKNYIRFIMNFQD